MSEQPRNGIALTRAIFILLSWNVVEKFLPALEVVQQQHFEYSVKSAEGFGDMYQSLRHSVLYNHADTTDLSPSGAST